ncbi:MAG: hypothetical protein IPN79_20155 [Saprospiraceae bacterium]|nr:hypothetical protein [Saprospiraceae bacterium]
MKIQLVDTNEIAIDVLKKYDEFLNLNFVNNLYFGAELDILTHGNIKLDQENRIIFNNCNFVKGFHFQIDINHATFNKIRIIFQNCIIHKCLDPNSVKNLVINQDTGLDLTIEFLRCVLTDLEFKHSKFKYIYFGNCVCLPNQGSRLFFENCTIDSIQLQNYIGMLGVNDNGNSSIYIRYSDDNIYVEKSLFDDFVSELINNLNSTKIWYQKTRFYLNNCKNINFEGVKSGKVIMGKNFEDRVQLFLTKDDLKLLDIGLSIKDTQMFLQNILIKGAWINSLLLKNISKGVCRFEKCKINKVFIHDYTNPFTTIYDIESYGDDSLFEIRDSTLADSTIDKVKFGSFDRVSFYRTSLEKAKFSAVSFPNEIEALSNILYPLEKSDDYHIEQYETYRQLSNALSSQGNQVLALELYKRMYESLRKSKSLSKQDRLILWLNNFSNLHGTSISRSLWLFLGLGATLLLLFINCTPKPMYSWGWIDFSSFIDAINIKVFFVLADPTHKISTLQELAGGELSTSNYFISFISRVVMAWVYYQFISAFRKFGKKTSS